jgi:PilZ domain
MFFRKKKDQDLVRRAELRQHYRRSPGKKHALGVKVLRDGLPPVAGDLADLSAGGAGVSFSLERDPELEPSQVVRLSFTSLVHGGEVVGEAKICSSYETTDEHGGAVTRRYGLEFCDREMLFAQLDAYYFKFFNRRRAMRVRPALDTNLLATLAFGPGRMQVQINDISADGFGVLATPEKASMLEEVEDLTCTFNLPKSDEPFCWQAQALHLSSLAHGVLFGAVFLIPDEPEANAQRQLLADYCGDRMADMARWDTAYGD